LFRDGNASWGEYLSAMGRELRRNHLEKKLFSEARLSGVMIIMRLGELFKGEFKEGKKRSPQNTDSNPGGRERVKRKREGNSKKKTQGVPTQIDKEGPNTRGFIWGPFGGKNRNKKRPFRHKKKGFRPLINKEKVGGKKEDRTDD